MHALSHALKLPRTYIAHTTKAKQEIFIFAPRDQKCLAYSRVLTGLDKGHSQGKKMVRLFKSRIMNKVLYRRQLI